jgi:hypothetical protein
MGANSNDIVALVIIGLYPAFKMFGLMGVVILKLFDVDVFC